MRGEHKINISNLNTNDSFSLNGQQWVIVNIREIENCAQAKAHVTLRKANGRKLFVVPMRHSGNIDAAEISGGF